jgi:glycolate oxidase
VAFCRNHGIPVTTRGAGTGLSGGAVASPGALLLSTENLKEIEIFPEEKIAFCGPGAITKALQDRAEEFGLTYPPDPASYEESSMGGNVAENAGGLRCKRYGVTKDYVIGLEAVTASGELLKTGYFTGYRGFSLTDVLIGSEGTLAIITRIAVRLVPAPGKGATILAVFDSMPSAARTVRDITTSGLIPTVMEFIDADAAACSIDYEDSAGLERPGSTLLMETSEHGIVDETRRIEQFCRKNGAIHLAVETEPTRVDELWRIRRNISRAVKARAGYAMSEDVVVPNSRFPDLVAWVAEENHRSPLRINSFGHAGDGNLHVYFISEDGSDADLRLIDEGVERLMRKTLELGGTLSGEHGIGLAKRKYLHLEFDRATIAFMEGLREIFDPGRLLNPDKLFAANKN